MSIKIQFSDFWVGFNREDNYFLNLLKKHFDVRLVENEPDFLFFSVFGFKHYNYKCKKIFYTGENVRPDFSVCDYSFTFDYENHGGRNYRLPLYVQYDDVNKLTTKKNPEKILSEKTGFCNFVFSNPNCKKRVKFFKKLSKYKKIDAGGRVLNNIGYLVPNKREFISKYKFTIAFENGEFPGYTTEKIFEPMISGSVPLYWGNPLVGKDFNTKSFLSYYDYFSDDDFIDRIIEVDSNDDLYLKILEEPFFINNTVNEFVKEENIIEMFNKIFNDNSEPIYLKSPAYSDSVIKRKSYQMINKIKRIFIYIIKNIRTMSLLKLKIKFQTLQNR